MAWAMAAICGTPAEPKKQSVVKRPARSSMPNGWPSISLVRNRGAGSPVAGMGMLALRQVVRRAVTGSLAPPLPYRARFVNGALALALLCLPLCLPLSRAAAQTASEADLIANA